MTINKEIKLLPLEEEDRAQFIKDNQEAFLYGATEEFGLRNDSFEEEGQIISRETIEASIKEGEAYRIFLGDEKVGGVVVKIKRDRGYLDLLFTSPQTHSKGIGYAAWSAIEDMYPQVKVWETVTPYFEQRNIHFYVNRCGFHIVEFFNRHHPDPKEIHSNHLDGSVEDDAMFRFEKRMIK